MIALLDCLQNGYSWTKGSPYRSRSQTGIEWLDEWPERPRYRTSQTR